MELANFETTADPAHRKQSRRSLVAEHRRSQVLLRRKESLVKIEANPWENDAKWTWGEIIWCLCVGWMLATLRVLFATVLFLSLFLTAWIATAFKPLDADRGCYYYKQPLAGWRKKFGPLWRLLMKGFVRAFGFQGVDVVNGRSDADSTFPKIFVIAPHLTFLDIFLLAAALPFEIASVGRIENLAIFPMVRFSHSIIMNLSNSESRHAAADAIASRANAAWTGPPLAMFPEGNMTNGTVMIGFKNGAFNPGEPVMPILLSIYGHYWNWNLACVGKNKPCIWAFRLMCQPLVHCKIELLDTYWPSEAEKSDSELYAKNVRHMMSARLGIGVTEHSMADKILFMKAQRFGFAPDFEVRALQKIYELSIDDLMEMMVKFNKLDVNGRGNITPRQALEVLRLNSVVQYSPKALERMLRLFDTDGSGAIEYREFVQVMALMSRRCNSQSMAKIAFLLCDFDGRGKVSVENLQVWLNSSFGLDGTDAGAGADAHADAVSSRTSVEQAVHSLLHDLLYVSNAEAGEGGGPKRELDFQEYSQMVEDNRQLFDEALQLSMKRFDP